METPAVQTTFDFDHLSRLARDNPAAFEAHRQALFDAALAEVPPLHQGAVRAALAQVQVKMAAAPNPGARLAAAMSALGASMQELQHALRAVRHELVPRGGALTTAR
jgi:hypothetical protein